jgi:hypothetical protein
MDYGVNKFIPKEDTAPTLSADSVVFWPLKTYTQNGYNSNTGYGSALTTGTDGYTAASATTPDPTYQIIPLVGNPGKALNWGTSDGYMLGDGHGFGLHQKFCMADQAGFGTMYNILGGNWEPGAEGTMLVAPIGSNGVEATIPKGCVAFRVNTGGTNTVRVIVAVPTTEKYRGETGFEIDLSNDYYIGVWNVAAANEGTTFQFNKADALEKFELPRSYTFQTEKTPENMAADSFQDHVVVSYGGKEYRTYLNGGCVLVAYEFTVTGEGVYIIGSVHGTNNTVVTNDMPMEIVHFSVSGTASAGRDGVAGSKVGSVDFVYDDGTSIVTMDKIGLTDGLTNEEGNENYANYYASQALLHTNNSAQLNGVFVNINYTRISIRRYVKEVTGADSNTYGQTTITYVVGPPDSTQEEYILVNPYMLNSDEIERTVESTTS